MEINKELFECIKQRYIENLSYSQEMVKKYKKCLDKYLPERSSKYLYEKYMYHKTANEIFVWVLKDLELLEVLKNER